MAVAFRDLFGRRNTAGGAEIAAQVTGLAQGWSIEITARQAAKLERLPLPKGTRVNIAYLPDEEPSAILQTAARLVFEGMVPVPHVPARTLPSAMALDTYLRGLAAVGVREALVIGGGVAQQQGPFASSMDVLRSGLFEELGFSRVAVAGHPEGSPDISVEGLAAALAEKNAWAEAAGLTVELMTQFCFDAGKVAAWERAIRAAGNRLPIRVGLPGPASIKSLLRYAQMCGVGNSLAFLSKRGGNVLQLVTAAEPDGFIVDLARALAGEPGHLVAGLHFYPFGGFEKTAHYADAVAAGRFTVEGDGQGFSLTA
ncbi:methylenetetrahydrofolate reductase [Geminicoccus harenae]|uniref:metFprotein n=1 Tax=Geminicoccus harenae TaxID=2498453 RepID=UPI00168B26F0|nr:metFprotein [Geminicoccus harenae]